jgi:thymidylate synthase ThyX
MKPHTTEILVGVTDHYNPIVQAMMLAMYSRNYGPIMSRLPKTPEEEATLEKRLEQYYVGYGHKSVGQLGATTVFFEGVSQLAAKAIEDDPLFDGQESSTRYMDFSEQPMVNFGVEEIAQWQEKWRALYLAAIPATIEKLKAEFPFQLAANKPATIGEQSPEKLAERVEKDKVVWERTIKARAFDICRGLLPAGVTTNVGFFGTFDVLNDHFGEMLFHPSIEMRNIARDTIYGLRKKYPHSTPGLEKLLERNAHVTAEYFYTDNNYDFADPPILSQSSVMSNGAGDLFLNRTIHQRLMRSVASAYRYKMRGLIDFGSFRDLHRHRNGTILMPMLTAKYGIHDWYLSELPPSIAGAAVAYLDEQSKSKALFDIDPMLVQYAIPMGAQVEVSYSCDLNQLIYILERRSYKDVHQTLRHYVQEQYLALLKLNPNQAHKLQKGLHVDMDLDNFTLKRGTQTFAGEFK